MSTLQPSEEQVIVLRQKVFDLSHELEIVKIQNENLMNEVAELKEKQKQQKQINDMLVNNLKNSQQQMNDQITLNINGEFLTQRIHELEEELEKYKSGVCESVDRRVKKIVNEYTQEKQLEYEKKKSRLSMGPRPGDQSRKYYETHQHKYFNIEYKNYSDYARENSESENQRQPNKKQSFGLCENCLGLKQLIAEKDEMILKLTEQLRLLQEKMMQGGSEEKGTAKNNSNAEEWKLKYLQTLKLYQNLRQNYDQLQDDYSNLAQNQTKNQRNSLSPIKGFKKKPLYPLPNANPCESRFYNEPKEREEVMLQEITNLVNGLGRAKKTQSKQNYQPQQHQNSQKQHIYIQDKKSRISYTNGASRISQGPKLDTSQFTIKQGVNRYGQENELF